MSSAAEELRRVAREMASQAPGEKRESALRRVADALGLTPRRVKGLVYNEPWRMTVEKDAVKRARSALRRHLASEAERLRVELEWVEARLRDLDAEDEP